MKPESGFGRFERADERTNEGTKEPSPERTTQDGRTNPKPSSPEPLPDRRINRTPSQLPSLLLEYGIHCSI